MRQTLHPRRRIAKRSGRKVKQATNRPRKPNETQRNPTKRNRNATKRNETQPIRTEIRAFAPTLVNTATHCRTMRYINTRRSGRSKNTMFSTAWRQTGKSGPDGKRGHSTFPRTSPTVFDYPDVRGLWRDFHRGRGKVECPLFHSPSRLYGRSVRNRPIFSCARLSRTHTRPPMIVL